MRNVAQKYHAIMAKLKPYAPTVIRLGIALVFLWFGTNQFINTNYWLGYVPQSVSDLLHLSATTLVHINALFELIFGLALFFGFYTRLTALLLALHLIDIIFIVGYSDIAARDFGLMVACVSIFLNGSDFFTLDRYMAGSTNEA